MREENDAIFRYELFLDAIGPDHLNPEFLKDFMSLPLQYYAPGAPDVLRECQVSSFVSSGCVISFSQRRRNLAKIWLRGHTIS